MSTIVLEPDGDVAIVRLNRPAVLNALNVELLEALVAALAGAREAAALVIEGEGRAFCVGEDLKQTLAPRTGSAEELRHSLELLQDATRLLTALPCAVVAAVQGFAIGGGAELALAADLVIGAPGTRFRFPEVSLGHAVTGGITTRLPAIVGLLKAKELLLTSRWIDAEEAERLGLVNELDADPSARARELAGQLGRFPKRSMAATKRGLELAAVGNQEAVLAAEVDAATYCFASEEASLSIDDFRGHR